MHTAIVLYFLKKESQLNEVVQDTKSVALCLLNEGQAQLLMINKISTYLCPKDERENLKKLKASPGLHKSLLTTQ